MAEMLSKSGSNTHIEVSFCSAASSADPPLFLPVDENSEVYIIVGNISAKNPIVMNPTFISWVAELMITIGGVEGKRIYSRVYRASDYR
ncbi:hypothetical protein BC938DRAFT_470516 [Jimgerdemannia flammicorona]|uniref:Uncharacterized protein n=1 Tax=Jimgerdemannia flammicorona TaxID=994334 RepID=A0A433QA75_9FUNG|nr:hypothetical protein BC938DRAFT_470516 [Jimgerdemannia flammicorona]